jgi:hypothetical protein
MSDCKSKLIPARAYHTIVVPKGKNHRIVWDGFHQSQIGVEISNNGQFPEGNRCYDKRAEYFFWKEANVVRAVGSLRSF